MKGLSGQFASHSVERRLATFLRTAAIACSTLLLFAPLVRAQSISGSITGSVRDPSNLAVPGANIVLTEVAMSAERRAITNDQGDFVLNALSPGTYLLTVQFQGFKSLRREGIQLTASERLSLGNLVLEVGAPEQNINVSSEGTAVQTASSDHSAVITGTQAGALEIRGRNVTSMMRLLPGVVDTAEGASGQASGNSNSEENISKFFYFNVQGTRANATNVTLDGIDLLEPGGDSQVNVAVGLDAVAEVKVMLGNYEAQYGKLSGGNIELVSKSGTRDFHGGGSYFKRHEEFNATNFFNNQKGIPKPWYRFNTYNYNISGPIYIPRHFNRDRNKLFVFWTQEYWPLTVTGPVQNVTVPTALERAGDFSQSVNSNGSLIIVTDPTNHQPFPGNKIPANRFDPNGQALLNFFPAANFLNRAVSAGNYNYVSQIVGVTPNHVNTWKSDYNIGPADHLAFTFSEHVRREEGYASRSSVTWPMNSVRIRSRSLFFSWNYQHIFSPTLVNEFTTGWTQHHGWDTIDPDQLAKIQGATTKFNPGQLYSPPNPLGLVPQASFGGVPNAATVAFGATYPLNNDREIFNLADNLTKVLGSHTIKLGGLFEHKWIDDGPTATYASGYFNFSQNANNPLDTGYAYSNALLGNFYQYQQASRLVDPERRNRTLNWFVQDNWKATRRLTLDYGIRFYYIQSYFEARGLNYGFVFSQYNPAQAVRLIGPAVVGGVRVGVNPANGAVYASTAIGAMAPGTGNPTNGMVSVSDPGVSPLPATPPVQLAPRFGFAYDPFGNGKTAIRGGFGMFYGDPPCPYSGLSTGYPNVTTPTINFSTLSTFLNAPGLIYPQNVLGVDPKLKLSLSMNINLAVQRDLGFGTVMEVAYVGTLGRHLLWQRQTNAIPLGANFAAANIDPTNGKPLPSQFEEPIVGYGNIGIVEAASSSNYHSMQVSVNRRFARNLQFGASWTWSKTMDYNDSDGDSIVPLVPRSYYYGMASFDRTHALKINWLYDLPKVRLNWAPAQHILNNWQLAGIVSFVSGAPTTVSFTTTNGMDITGTSSLGPRVNVVCNPMLSKGDRTFYKNFNTSCFQLPAVGTFGNAARTELRGPGISNFDLSVFKNFTIRERLQVQFRCEAYNAFNHTQFSAFNTAAQFSPTGQQVNTNFGAYTAARNPRIGQLALKVTF